MQHILILLFVFDAILIDLHCLKGMPYAKIYAIAKTHQGKYKQ